MLPLQITLDGFMSYRDETTLSFEGKTLWMLTGANGAGKSSVFDAMRFTLFGAHRGGRAGHEALINHGRDRMRVAFDIELDTRRFRLIRTLARAGRSTWQIEVLNGDDFDKIPETDMREGYEKWVRESIGLSDDTFTTAMYLAQNRGDAILSANPAQRYEMLAEIVDISAYAALHEQVKSRASQLEIAARVAERSWQDAPDADAEAIAEWDEKQRDLSAQITENVARRERILGLEPLAKQWQTAQTEFENSGNQLAAARAQFGDAARLERDFARQTELDALLPSLSRYVETRERAAANWRAFETVEREQNAAHETQNVCKTGLEIAQSALGELETARDAAQRAQLELATESAQLAPRLSKARQIALYRAEIVAFSEQLAAFSTDISVQKQELETRIEQTQEELRAGAILERFAAEKTRYLAARGEENAAQNAFDAAQNALDPAKLAAQSKVEQLENRTNQQARALEIAAATTARLSDAENALARFESVENEANCFVCGQQLTPEHAQNERFRLENSLQNARNEAENAAIRLENARQSAQNAQSESKSTQKTVEKCEKAAQMALDEQKNARNLASNAVFGAQTIFDELGEFWHRQFPAPEGDETARIESLLAGEVPLLAQVEKWKSQAPQLKNWRGEVRALDAQQTEQKLVASRLADRRNQLAPLENGAELEDLEPLLERETELEKALKTARQTLRAGETPLQNARAAQETAARELDAALAAVVRLETQRAGLEAARTEIARAVESQKTPQLGAFAMLNALDLRAQFEALEREKLALGAQDLAAQLEARCAAQSRAQELEIEVARWQKSLENLPPEARRAPDELARESDSLRATLAEQGAAQTHALAEKNRLEARRAAKSRLEREHLDAQNAARQHKTLADLLGPHELQRYLLREAENGILDEANATLDRISGGELRLELRDDDEEIAGARKGVSKVFDITVFRGDEAPNAASESGGKERGAAMLPAFLSGSQRFRVAVALALGIGRFATRGGGSRLESVIIDEGFGSLDKIGRNEMIDELHALGEELGRVILVSHQEEFFETFPNRYLIENNGETSTAQLMAG